MFNNFFSKKEKPRIFLGTLSVLPRTGFKKFLESGFYSEQDIDLELRKSLEDIFTLPLASEVLNPLKTDLVLDVYVPNFQQGLGGDAELGILGGFTFFWRPKVNVKARLFNLQTKKTEHVFSSTEVITGWRFINGVMSLKYYFGLKPPFSKNDMNELLYKACHNILIQIQNKL